MDAISLLKGGNLMLPVLTDRENQVLKLIAYGFTNREISRDLSISESTVENHIHHIFTKLGISNRAQAVGHAFHLRIVLLNDLLDNRGNPS
jgi:ATP/maltotriose-dependent transcriptional regulator MalT